MALIEKPAVMTETDLFLIKHPSSKGRAIPMTMRIKKHTTLVAFRRYYDAELVAEAMEAQYMQTKEWPDLTSDEFSIKYLSTIIGLGPPTLLDIQPERYEVIQGLCINWGLNLCIIEEIQRRKNTINLTGDVLSFTAPAEYYRMIYELLWTDFGE